jgi:4-oxalocrotonate tautomerase
VDKGRTGCRHRAAAADRKGASVPIIEVKMLAGRTPEQKTRFSRELTEVAVRVLEVCPEAVRVIIQEVEPAHWSVGGVSFADRSP